MRRAWSKGLAGVGLVVLAAGVAGAAERGSRWAIIVGIDEYNDKKIPRLSGAVADARGIRDALVRYAGFPDKQVVLLTTDNKQALPTAAEIVDSLSRVGKTIQADDLLLFFFAGHGVEVSGQRYLLSYDADIGSEGKLKTTSLSAGILMSELGAIRAKHRVILIDACRNDPTNSARPNIATDSFEQAFTLQCAKEGGVCATFLSCSKGQSAYEWAERKRGFFSYFIEKGIAGEAAVRGRVTFTSLIDYLDESVPRAVTQYRNREQTPYTKFEGPSYVLVEGAQVSAASAAFDKPPQVAATRTVYGVVKDSSGRPLKGATVTLVRVAPAAGGKRSLVHVEDIATPNAAAKEVAEVKVVTDDDGFFKADVKPADADLQVKAEMGSYVVRTVSSPAKENGKKISLFLPVDTPTPPAPPSPTAVRPPTPGKVDKAAEAEAARKTQEAAAAAAFAAQARRSQEMANAAYRTFLAEDFREAEKLARLALEADKESALANAVLGTSLLAGVEGSQAGKVTEARAAIDRALKKEPGLALAHNGLGLVLLTGGDMNGAKASFQKAVQLDAKLGVAYGNLGFVHWRQNRLDDARKAYERASDLTPESAVTRQGLSNVLHSMGKFGDAEKAARAAINRYQLQDENLAAFYVQLGVSLYEQARGKVSKRDQALDALARAKALGSRDPAIAKIEGIKG